MARKLEIAKNLILARIDAAATVEGFTIKEGARRIKLSNAVNSTPAESVFFTLQGGDGAVDIFLSQPGESLELVADGDYFEALTITDLEGGVAPFLLVTAIY